MLLSLRASSSRIASAIPSLAAARTLSTTPVRHVKRTVGPSQTPMDLLKLIGRNADARLGPQAETWEQLNDLYKKGTWIMADAGLTIKERKYVMLALTQYTKGQPPRKWVRAVRPPKKFRAIQHGVRVWGKGSKRVRWPHK